MLLSYVATWSLSLQSSFSKMLSVYKVDLNSWDLSTGHSFSIVNSTGSNFILILVSFSLIYVNYICCCDWDKLCLLVVLLKILLIMLSWYPFSFDTCFILAFSRERALLNKRETTISLQIVWWGCCSVVTGQHA